MSEAALPVILPCYVNVDIGAALKKNMKEHEIANGITVSGEKFSIHVDESSGRFTVLLYLPQKVTCVLSAGTDFEVVKQGDDL